MSEGRDRLGAALAESYAALRRTLGGIRSSDPACDTDDLFQEALARLLASGVADRCPTPRDLKNYVGRSMVNHAIDLGRRRKPVAYQGVPEVVPAHGPDVDDQAVARVLLDAALASLGHNEALMVMQALGYPDREIGEALGIAPGTVKTRAFRWRARHQQEVSA